jgi:hypothetical protein
VQIGSGTGAAGVLEQSDLHQFTIYELRFTIVEPVDPPDSEARPSGPAFQS